MKWFTHPITILFFTLVAVVFFFSLEQSGQKSAQSQNTVSQLTIEVEKLEAENKALEVELKQAETPLNQEKQVRDQLLMKKPGEYVVQFAQDPRTKQVTPPQEEKETPLAAWKRLIF